MTAPSTPVLPVPAPDAPAAGLHTPVCDPLPLPLPGWGEAQARDAVAEAALVLPALAGPAALVRALSTVVFRVGEAAVKVHPPGTDPAHLAAVHAVLAESPVALTATAAPVVTSSGVVTVTPWTAPGAQLGWGEVGRVLRALHELPNAAALPAWTPLRRLPAQLEHLPPSFAQRLWDARSSVLERLAGLAPVLPLGAVHGDVSPENVLSTATGPRWIDLDFACAGPREYDLAAVVRRYAAGELSDADYRAFVLGYGADLRGWPGLALLDELCALSGVGFRLWLDRLTGRTSGWLDDALERLSPEPAAR